MRNIIEHMINPLNDKVMVQAMDEPGPGGANHQYRISDVDSRGIFAEIPFQKGPIGEVGVNGISNEALIAIVLDRLRAFQQGEFRSRLNALAITDLESAMNWLHRRTLERMRRGVEGTNEV